MRVVSLLAALVLIGCSSAPPERSFYLLRDAPVPSADGATEGLVGIDRVSLAAYLDRAELVVQTGPHEIRPARYHHWGEPLDEGIRHYVRAALTNQLGRDVAADVLLRDAWVYRIDITVETFHGTLSGTVELVAGFALVRVSDGQVLAMRRIVASEQQRGDGYNAMVDAQAALLDRLATEIAALVGPALNEG